MWSNIVFFIIVLLSTFKITYRVKNGDSLYKIAKKFKVTVNQLKKWNNIKKNLIKPGMKIVIYKDKIIKKKIYVVKKGDNLIKIAKKLKTSVSQLRAWNRSGLKLLLPGQKIVYYKQLYKSNNKQKVKKRFQKKSRKKQGNKKNLNKKYGKIPKKIIIWHKIKKGDSLWKIAKKYKVSIKAIKRINSRKSIKILRPGKKIKIPIFNPNYIYVMRPYLKNFLQMPYSKYIKFKNRNNTWGQKYFIDTINKCIENTMEKYPASSKIVVGDISKKTGGYFPPHLSHRTGRDIDIGYFLKHNKQLNYFKTINPDELDVEKNWSLIQECLKTGMVEFIFIDYSLQKPLYQYAKQLGYSKEELNYLFQYPSGKRVKKGVIRHFKGHKHHIHIRLKCPANDRYCR